jgi:hypothetical protein
MKNAVFWDIKPQFVPYRRHTTSSQETSAGEFYVRFEVSMAVAMKNVVLWDVTSSGSCKDRRFGGTCPLHHQGDKSR